jgi:hypothetical protein
MRHIASGTLECDNCCRIIQEDEIVLKSGSKYICLDCLMDVYKGIKNNKNSPSIVTASSTLHLVCTECHRPIYAGQKAYAYNVNTIVVCQDCLESILSLYHYSVHSSQLAITLKELIGQYGSNKVTEEFLLLIHKEK